MQEDLVEAITEALPAGRIVFEAPRKEQQAWMIRRIGPNVNLGNIPPAELLALETLRLGLRADTLDLLPAVVGDPSSSSREAGGRARDRSVIPLVIPPAVTAWNGTCLPGRPTRPDLPGGYATAYSGHRAALG